MNLVNILFCLCFLTFQSVIGETTFALNTYVCSVIDGGFFTAQSKLVGQDKTSHSVTIEFVDSGAKYQTLLSQVEFENVEDDLCTYAYVVNSVLQDDVSTKEFSRLMTLGLETNLEFLLVDNSDDTDLRVELLRRLHEASKFVEEYEDEIEEEVEEEDIIEL